MKIRCSFILACLVVISCTEIEEQPTCFDGLQNGDETGIDCGGICLDAYFDCLSEFCRFISGRTSLEDQGMGRSSIRWKVSLINGEIPVSDGGEKDIWMSRKYTFYSDGDWMVMDMIVGTVTGRWQFDNPESPSQIVIFYDYGSPSSRIKIHSLKQGELVEEAGVDVRVTFVPDDS